jgi:hypothetical protein
MKKNYFTNQFIMYVCLFGLLIGGVSCEKEDPLQPVKEDTEKPVEEEEEPAADLVNFNNITLSSKQEVPLNRSEASGTYSLEYDKNSNVLSYTINYTGTTPTAMHFHTGEIGMAGDVAAAVEGPYTSGMTGSITLTEEQEADLLAGKWYLNIHSDAYAAGEIRGQAVMENQVVFSNIELSGSEEVPANNSTATGVFNGLYDKSTKKLTYTLSLDGVTATGMHLHKGAVGMNGDVVTEITGTSGTTAALTAEQEADLLAGNLYLNVHSDAFPGGEIRGQVMTGHQDETTAPEEEVVTMNNILLSSKQEVPQNSSAASGTYSLEYEKNSNVLTYTINYSGTTPTAMHFHTGEIGMAGDVAAAVEGPYTSGMTGSITLTEEQEADLLAGKWYLNVHSDAFAAGEIRGQAVMENQVVFSNIHLSGSEEVPANSSAATGVFNGLYDKTTKMLTYTVSLDAVTSAGMHLHKGAVGENGEVVAEITGTSGTTAALTADQEADLLAGNLYLNVHSAEFPGGEIRGQVVTDEKVVFSNSLSGENEVPASESAATGTFYGVYDQTTKELSYTIVYDGVMPTAMHFHKAAAGENGEVVMAVEGPFSSGMTGSVTVTEAQEADLLQGLWYLNVHSETHPGGEVRAQLVK